MTTTAFLSRLQALGIRLNAVDGRLRFQDPEGALTPELRSELVHRKSELLAFLEEARAVAVSDEPPLVRLPRTGPLPTSSGQQRLWFLERLHPGTCAYNIPAAFRLRGALDVGALRRSFEGLMGRHEALRATFAEGPDGTPVQRIAPIQPFLLPVDSIADEDEAYRRSLEEGRLPFDLEAGPLLRARLLRHAAEDHTLLVTVHHAASDGWSTGILARDLGALYAAERTGVGRTRADRAGAVPTLAPLPIGYPDYAAWQRARLERPDGASGLAYWTGRLTPLPEPLELPTDRPRPPVQRFRGENKYRALPPPLVAALRDRAREEGASLFMVLLAAYATLLHRYTGQTDLVVGTPVAGRTRPETEDLIGFFVNTLPLRLDLAGRPSFRALVARVREIALDAFSHQEVPFERIVEALQPERSLGRSPLVQALFVHQNTPPPVLRLAGAEATPVSFFGGTAKFDLSLFVEEAGDSLRLVGEYDTALFEGATVERLLGHYEALLRAGAEAPATPIDEFPLMGEAERAAVAALARGPVREAADGYDLTRPLHALVAEQAARTPEAIAVVLDDGPAEGARLAGAEGECASLTYGALEVHADALAHRLGALGVGRGDVVAVVAERTLALPVALLGVLKAGAAYLPLDPAHPPERLRFTLEDAGAAAVLALDRHAARLAAAVGPATVGLPAPVVILGKEGVVAGDEPTRVEASPTGTSLPGASLPAVGPSDAAYVIYTSGSTGRPKGVVVEHAAIVNRLHWHQEAFALAPGEAVLQKTPATFDVSVWELFWPLLTGGRLVLARPGREGDPGYLAGALARHGIVACHFVPSMLRAFLEAAEADLDRSIPGGSAGAERQDSSLVGSLARCGRLRSVISSGEALSPELVRRFYAVARRAGLDGGPPSEADVPTEAGANGAGGLTLHNLYGPTEAAVDVTHWLCPAPPEAPADPAEGSTGVPAEGSTGVPAVVPIGRPIANTRCYVLDAAGRPCPVGVWGELHLGGVQVARGYLRRPELTAERFVPDPFVAGERMYRTGDVVRWRRDGTLEYRGRSDGQVKVRGFRIELGEVEAALRSLDAVSDAAVVLRDDVPGGPALAGYVVAAGPAPGSGRAPSSATLRAQLSRLLPDYMVPAAFVSMPALPLTSSGKLDRKALPAPKSGPRAVPFAAPENEVERAVVAAWQAALRREGVGLDDNFFDLGGHSLLAVQVQRHLQEALGREVALLDLFAHPTVRALAAHLDGDAEAAPSAGLDAAVARAARQRAARQRAARPQRRPNA